MDIRQIRHMLQGSLHENPAKWLTVSWVACVNLADGVQEFT